MYKYVLLDSDNIVASVSEHTHPRMNLSDSEMDVTDEDYDLYALLGKKWTGSVFIDIGNPGHEEKEEESDDEDEEVTWVHVVE